MGKQHVETLYDYKDRLPWVERLGWSDKRLRGTLVHQESSGEQPFIALPMGEMPGEAGIRQLYVYQGDVPLDVFQELAEALSRDGQSGQDRPGIFGRENVQGDFPHPY